MPVSFEQIITFLGLGAALGLGVTALLRRPLNISKLAFGLGMLVLSAEIAFGWMALRPQATTSELFWMQCRLTATALVPGLWVFFSLAYGRGNYREFLARWWPTLLVAAVVPVALALWYFPVLVFKAAPGQSAVSDSRVYLTWPSNAICLVSLMGSVLVLMNLERTFRSAVGTMRWRLKFFVVGLAVLFGERIYASSQAFLFSSIHANDLVLDAVAILVAALMISLSIRRSSLFKVDVYPSHAFLHHSITAVFAGVYLLAVGVLAKLVGVLGTGLGPALQGVTILVALAALGVLLFSDRVKQWLRRFISRHLRRPVYDYRRIWNLFTERTASLLDTPELCRSVVRLVSETFTALSVTIWLVDHQRRRLSFGASTSLPEGTALGLSKSDEGFGHMVDEMLRSPGPVDIDARSAKWLEQIRGSNPEHFKTGGHRLCVPLIARSQLLGLMTLGDRVAGQPYSAEDLDLLTCVADQVANALLNAGLTQRVLESKQMEAFQTMSTFFVHDLKNTASTLSLMLQNLPIHFDNPEFRRDALRGVGKTVEHINELIQRLSLLRSELKLRAEPGDLNRLVESLLGPIEAASKVPIVRKLGEIPLVPMDREQLGKVLTNLVLNAREALPDRGGEITVETFREHNWVALVVTDNGCGMSPEFADKQLFKPFQTTKKKGIGIGMFQSKMIVEAHQGRIDFETEQGVGTRFRILLPIERSAS